jgi:hypothetical protein
VERFLEEEPVLLIAGAGLDDNGRKDSGRRQPGHVPVSVGVGDQRENTDRIFEPASFLAAQVRSDEPPLDIDIMSSRGIGHCVMNHAFNKIGAIELVAAWNEIVIVGMHSAHLQEPRRRMAGKRQLRQSGERLKKLLHHDRIRCLQSLKCILWSHVRDGVLVMAAVAQPLLHPGCDHEGYAGHDKLLVVAVPRSVGQCRDVFCRSRLPLSQRA